MNHSAHHSVRLMQQADLDQVLAWRNHPDVARYMLHGDTISVEQHHHWFAHSQTLPGRQLLIYLRNGEAAGFCQLNAGSTADVADWGFYLAPEAPRGSGYGLGQAALDYAFRQQGLFKVCGQVLQSNPRSQRFHLRLGFVREGVLRAQHKINEQRQDLICYGLLRSEWQARQDEHEH